VPTVLSNFQFYRGEDISIPDTVYQADGVTPQDITGWSVQFLMRPQDIPGVTSVRKTTGGGIVLTTPAAGLLTITLASADTAGLYPGPYAYAVERTDVGADAVLSAGVITLLAK